ncbi:MAG TPA: LysM peptidoglycan-binding domain-containing protein [Burkholderiales bacterium]
MKPLSLSLVLFVTAGMVGCASTQTAQPEPAPAPQAETAPAPQPESAPAPVAQPEPAPAPQPREEVVTGPSDDSYTVVPGDHLWGISAMPSIYGDPYRWPLIYKANTDKIEDADLIYPGQVLTIRRGNTPAEIDAAVQHARTRGAWTLGSVEETDRQYLAGQRFAGR